MLIVACRLRRSDERYRPPTANPQHCYGTAALRRPKQIQNAGEEALCSIGAHHTHLLATCTTSHQPAAIARAATALVFHVQTDGLEALA
jgi:hypothetical protein